MEGYAAKQARRTKALMHIILIIMSFIMLVPFGMDDPYSTEDQSGINLRLPVLYLSPASRLALGELRNSLEELQLPHSLQEHTAHDFLACCVRSSYRYDGGLRIRTSEVPGKEFPLHSGSCTDDESSMVSLGIFTAVFAFKDLMWPMIVCTNAATTTLSAGLAKMQGQYGSDYPAMMAAATLRCPADGCYLRYFFGSSSSKVLLLPAASCKLKHMSTGPGIFPVGVPGLFFQMICIPRSM